MTEPTVRIKKQLVNVSFIKDKNFQLKNYFLSKKNIKSSNNFILRDLNLFKVPLPSLKKNTIKIK